MTTEEILKLLNACCDKESKRFSLGDPFLSEGKAWATDGRILVSVDLDDELKAAVEPLMVEGRRFPKGVRECLEAPVERESEPTILPPIPPKIRCPECGGTGMQTCNLGHDHECEDCDENGNVEAEFSIPVGAAWIATRILRILRENGIDRVFVPTEFGDDGRCGSILFARDQVVGIFTCAEPAESEVAR